MLDSTICDIYLVNEAGGLVGRPILTACIDAYSGLCCGYTLSWEGGTYSLRGLMLSVIEDKAAYKDWQLQKVLNNSKPTFKYVCMIAMFLNIRIEELADMSLPEKSQEQLFDEKVRKLHEEGMKYPAIAERVGAPYDLVKAIGEGRYGTCHKPSRIRKKCGRMELDWEALDRETLPRVQAYIDQKRSAASGKPFRITLNSVEQVLMIPSKRLQKMPLCRECIQKASEPMEQYWARKLVWAHEHVKPDKPFSWGHIRKYVNIKRKTLCRCIPYQTMFTDQTTARMLEEMLTRE